MESERARESHSPHHFSARYTLTVLIMEVPCCMGLVGLAQEAAKNSKRKVPVKYIVVGLNGEIKEEEWLST